MQTNTYSTNYRTYKLKLRLINRFCDKLGFWQPKYRRMLVYSNDIPTGEEVELVFESASSNERRLPGIFSCTSETSLRCIQGAYTIPMAIPCCNFAPWFCFTTVCASGISTYNFIWQEDVNNEVSDGRYSSHCVIVLWKIKVKSCISVAIIQFWSEWRNTVRGRYKSFNSWYCFTWTYKRWSPDRC